MQQTPLALWEPLWLYLLTTQGHESLNLYQLTNTSVTFMIQNDPRLLPRIVSFPYLNSGTERVS